VKIVSWNIACKHAAWSCLLKTDADVALLQEASEPPPEVAKRIEAGPEPWHTPGVDARRPWRTAIAKLTDRVQVDWVEAKSAVEASSGELAVSRPGTLAAAYVTSPDGERFLLVSMYALWMSPHSSTESRWIVSDASAHRLVSDLSAFIGNQRGHRIIAAGDLNALYGYGERGSPYWAARYRTIFTRMDALGLPFVGPQAPHGRQQTDPWPTELPPDSRNVPTFRSSFKDPATATRQLDFVFASESLTPYLGVRAVNDPCQWGPSDHCRVEIEVSQRGRS